jgi:hypothetical protein
MHGGACGVFPALELGRSPLDIELLIFKTTRLSVSASALSSDNLVEEVTTL